MTIQFPQVDASESRLLPDSCKQNRFDDSFEEKLKFEQARLGLLFSPFSQLEAFFSSSLNPNSSSDRIENDLNSYLAAKQPQADPARSIQDTASQTRSSPRETQIFESSPLSPFNRQLLQELLAKTNWLVPNLEAQPSFYRSFLEGKLLASLDLQSLVDEIAEQVKLVKEKGHTELSLTLKPEELGEILLVLTSRSGMVSIEIQASAETKKLIESQRMELERALKKAKIHFDKIKIEEVSKYA